MLAVIARPFFALVQADHIGISPKQNQGFLWSHFGAIMGCAQLLAIVSNDSQFDEPNGEKGRTNNVDCD
jgi:hypothetical protein